MYLDCLYRPNHAARATVLVALRNELSLAVLAQVDFTGDGVAAQLAEEVVANPRTFVLMG